MKFAVGRQMSLVVILLAFSINTSAIILDIKDEINIPGAEIYYGRFKDRGIYKLFYSNDNSITAIKYGEQMVGSVLYRRPTPVDIYVQEYKRGDIRIISVHIYNSRSNKLYSSSYYHIQDEHCYLTTRDRKINFVGNVVYLEVDVHSEKVHPLVKKVGNGDYNIWKSLTASYGDYRKALRLRFNNEKHVLNPILHIENTSARSAPPNALFGLFARVKWKPGDKVIKVWIRRGRFLTPLSIRIPPTVNNIFKPRNITRMPYYFRDLASHFQPVIPIHLVIDISSHEVNTPYLIIMANLERGQWLYTQYTVVPLVDQLFLSHMVVNSHVNSELYRVRENEFVSHVELFKNSDSRIQYVVVNVTKYINHSLPPYRITTEIKRLYKLYCMDGNWGYLDLTDSITDEYLDILYNIPVDGSDVVLSDLIDPLRPS
ncbi:spherical body protein, putative [Babesia ovis]|uniref:Spherical body protein, putative n=1 Tax=Babesia ovis TaxID=5869 RepID=A0A9W5T979_BABOV|nr:spherical body protein, putative [Babesia ovis]